MEWVWEDLSFRGVPFKVAHFEAPGGKREKVSDDLVEHLDRCEVELGACLWQDTNHALLRFLERRRQGYAGLRVLEMGAGAGACGLALALDGADATLTDVDGLVPLLELNIVHNGLADNELSLDSNKPSSSAAGRRRRGMRNERRKGRRKDIAESNSDEEFPSDKPASVTEENMDDTVHSENETTPPKHLSARERRAARAEKKNSNNSANPDFNVVPSKVVPRTTGRCTAQAAEWNQEAQQPVLPAGAFDVVVVCDCVYDNEDSWMALQVILERGLAAHGEVVLASAMLRRPFLEAFSARLERVGFLCAAQEISEHAIIFALQPGHGKSNSSSQ